MSFEWNKHSIDSLKIYVKLKNPQKSIQLNTLFINENNRFTRLIIEKAKMKGNFNRFIIISEIILPAPH